MEIREIIIQHEDGVHARPASIFVREAARFKAEVELTVGATTVNGKSIMGLLMLAMSAGTKVILKTNGSDEAEAANLLASILTGEFEG